MVLSQVSPSSTFFHFIKAGGCQLSYYSIFSPCHDHTQCFHYYWHDGCFKDTYFFQFLFPVLCIYTFYHFTYCEFFTPVLTGGFTIGISVTFMFHSFLSSRARFKYSSIFLFYFILSLCSDGTANSIIRQVFFFFSLYIYIYIFFVNYPYVWSSGRD